MKTEKKPLYFKTIDGAGELMNQSSFKDRQKVFFTCHPSEFCHYFEKTSDLLLRENPSIVICYYEPDHIPELNEAQKDLSEMVMFVVPITKLFIEKDTGGHKYLEYAKKNRKFLLLIQEEYKIEDSFNKKFGNLHLFNPFDTNPEGIDFEQKISDYLNRTLIKEEVVKQIKKEFENRSIFISYRKKDRSYIHRLIRKIHSCNFARDIAVWYDEYLDPGENFDDSIKNAIRTSSLFAMIVTPNLVNESNYVQENEYPFFFDCNSQGSQRVFPVEYEPTDRELLESNYKDIPLTVKPDSAGFGIALKNALADAALEKKAGKAEHYYYTGLAYLSGIYFEINRENGLSYLEKAANMSFIYAIERLVYEYQYDYFYNSGDSEKLSAAFKWQKKLTEYYKSKSKTDPQYLIAYADALRHSAMLLYYSGDGFKKSFRQYLAESMAIREKMFDNNGTRFARGCAEEYVIRGILFARNKEYDKAIKEYNKARQIYEKFGCSKRTWGNLNFNTGIAYYNSGKTKDAFKYLKKITGRCEKSIMFELYEYKLKEICIEEGDDQFDELLNLVNLCVELKEEENRSAVAWTAEMFYCLAEVAYNRFGNADISLKCIDNSIDSYREIVKDQPFFKIFIKSLYNLKSCVYGYLMHDVEEAEKWKESAKIFDKDLLPIIKEDERIREGINSIETSISTRVPEYREYAQPVSVIKNGDIIQFQVFCYTEE